MKKIKILVNCHKPTPRLHDGIFTPILAGAAFADDKLKKEFAAELRDDTGDNISRLQPYCAELSAVYWALKHYGELGDPDYTGLFHYRRFLNFSDPVGDPDPWKCAFFSFDGRTAERFGWTEERINAFCGGYDLIVPNREDILDPNDWKTPATLETHYGHAHYPEDLDSAAELIRSLYPEYSDALDRALGSGRGHFCNMFVMTRELFFDYAQWLFSIILPLSRTLPLESEKYSGVNSGQKRVLGFLGERLLNVWIEKKRGDPAVRIRETERLTGYLTAGEKIRFVKRYGPRYYLKAAALSPVRAGKSGGDEREEPVELLPCRSAEKPAVSVLLPVYNVGPYLRECIESLVDQTLKNIELIFVYEPCGDDSEEILREYYEKDPRITLIRARPGIGMPEKRNIAMRYVRSDYFAFADSDDVCAADMFEKLYRKAEELSADITVCGVRAFTDSTENSVLHRPLEWYGQSDRCLPLNGRPLLLMEPAAWCKLFRTEYIRGLADFSFRRTRAWEDVPCITAAFIGTDRIAAVQEALYYYRQRSCGSLSSDMDSECVEQFVSGARLQREILDRACFDDEATLGHIEEFKCIYAQWMLHRLDRAGQVFFFRHAASAFALRDTHYLKRVFADDPRRCAVHLLILMRAYPLYAALRTAYNAAVAVRRALKTNRKKGSGRKTA